MCVSEFKTSRERKVIIFYASMIPYIYNIHVLYAVFCAYVCVMERGELIVLTECFLCVPFPFFLYISKIELAKEKPLLYTALLCYLVVVL